MDNYEKTIKVDNIYEGKILSLRVETVEMPDKKYSKREIVDHVKGVGIIAFDGEDSIYLVRQYRKAIDEFTLEIPAGLVEVNEKPIETAKRELQEEIGYKPLDIEYLFDMHASPGFTNDKLSFFLAKNLEEKKSYKIEDVYNMVINGEITDAKTIIAVMYAKRLIDEK